MIHVLGYVGGIVTWFSILRHVAIRKTAEGLHKVADALVAHDEVNS